MSITGSQAVMESLLKEDVDVIFGYPGGAIIPIYDALFDYGEKIRHILVRHEQGAVHAAEGYSRITGKPGVCFATSGPGATNLITGIADALMDSIPLVCVTGQVSASLVGTDAFQETDIIGVTTPITKWNYQVTDATEIPQVMAKAFFIAQNGRPGPVLIDVTKTAQFGKVDFSYTHFKKKNDTEKSRSYKEELQETAELLNNAKRPYVLVGHGVEIAKAEKEFKEFIEKGGFPTGATLLGLSAFPTNHSLYAGMIGMHGNYGANILTNQADVILGIGLRFDDRVTGNVEEYGKNAKIIHIDIDPSEPNKLVKTDISIVMDARQALVELTPLIKKNKHQDWLEKFKKCNTIENEKVIMKETKPNTPNIKMAEVLTLLSEKTHGEPIIIADVGQNQMITALYYRFQNPNSFLTSGGAGTMGFALPASIGAKIAAPNREVIAVVGDGGFQMTIQELATIAQEELPIKIIVLNNNFLGMVRQWQHLFFDKRYSFVNLKNPDFVQIAKGYYIQGQKVEKREDLGKGLDTMLKSKKPYLLEVVVEKEGNVFPMVPAGASVEEVRLE